MSTQPTEALKVKFNKKADKMTNDIENLKTLVQLAESTDQPSVTLDENFDGTARLWREAARLALNIADQQEWFDCYEDKYFKD